MPPVELTAVVEGKDLDPRRFKQEIERVLRDEMREIDQLYRAFYSTWAEAKPSMVKKISMSGVDAYAEVSTRGRTEDEGNKKLLWLDEGTQVRWAIVSKDWQSKTRPGQIHSGRGHGRVMARGKKATYHARRGRPGLKPRKISQAIVEEREGPFQDAVDGAVERAAE